MSNLYNPTDFRVDDAQVLADVVDQLAFATVVSNGPEGPLASHAPFLLARDQGPRGMLRGHLAKANPHVSALDDAPALILFQGPAHYVTPSWYASKRASGRVVPTWNYVVVHVRGRVRLHRDAAWLQALVNALTEHMERHRPEPWAVADAPADFVARMVDQIVGVEIAIETMEGKFKLGQNRSAADRASLAAGLAAERPDVVASLRPLPGVPTDL